MRTRQFREGMVGSAGLPVLQSDTTLTSIDFFLIVVSDVATGPSQIIAVLA